MIGGINIDADAEGVVHVTVRRFMTVKEGDGVVECIRAMAEPPVVIDDETVGSFVAGMLVAFPGSTADRWSEMWKSMRDEIAGIAHPAQ